MNTNRKKIDTNTMVKAAFLAALSIVLTRFLSIMLPIAGLPTIRIGFGGVPIFISGILFGPTVGGITGIVADLIGVLINPMGPYHPGFTFSAFLNGAIPGIFAIYFRKRPINGSFITFKRILMVEIFLGISNGIFLNTLWLTQILGKGFLILVPARAINTLVNVPIRTIIIYNILKYFKKETKVRID